MSSKSQGVTLRYTTDGSTPTGTSPAYTGAIAITETKTPFRTGWTASTVTTNVYTMKVATPPIAVFELTLVTPDEKLFGGAGYRVFSAD